MPNDNDEWHRSLLFSVITVFIYSIFSADSSGYCTYNLDHASSERLAVNCDAIGPRISVMSVTEDTCHELGCILGANVVSYGGYGGSFFGPYCLLHSCPGGLTTERASPFQGNVDIYSRPYDFQPDIPGIESMHVYIVHTGSSSDGMSVFSRHGDATMCYWLGCVTRISFWSNLAFC